METAQEVAQDLQVYEQFYNAEAYHLSKAKELGYISLEAAQYVFAAAIEKGLAKLGNFSLKKLA